MFSTPSGQHPKKNKSVAHTGQHDYPRSIGDLIEKDLAVVAKQQLDDVEGISPHVLEGETFKQMLVR